MEKFTDIIELLLLKKANLADDEALEVEVAIEAIKAKYAERKAKIDELLKLSGYEEPVDEEAVDEAEEVACETVYETVDEAVGETVEEAEVSVDDEKPTGVVNGSFIY